MQPLPWSFSSLEDFKNCPFAFYRKRVAKDVKDVQGEEAIWGERVHKHFEEFVKSGTPLPNMLNEHSPYLSVLASAPGQIGCELKVGLNRQLQPTGFFAPDVWYRGVLDYACVNHNQKRAKVVDYKTGKPHNKHRQLKLFALNVFALHSTVETVDTEFYWTKTGLTSPVTYVRNQWGDLWSEFVPDLKQYVQAFKTDTWQTRTSGLCNGWCAVQDCEFWRPKKVRR